MRTSYRLRAEEDEEGEALSRILPRSLMAPPGIPVFATRARVVDAGRVELVGRAWSGSGAIERVEVSDDDGRTWFDATLDAAPADPFAWRRWTFAWQASPGERVVCCRATDASGRTQPLEPTWNLGGYVNNAIQRIPILVR
jgi:hypothetical protein